ncbi:putative baseplate assembly protein [Hydrogenimonas sp.]
MGIEIPNLDTKRYEDRMEEAMALLPSLSGEWSDFNPSDPGITILELLAWLADVDAYRFNRITDAHRRAFLKIAGIASAAPRPARVLLAFQKRGARKTVPAGTLLNSDGVGFVTERSLTVTGCEIVRIVTEGFGERNEVPALPLYPFGKILRSDFSSILEFKEPLEGRVRLYFKVRPMSEVSDGADSLRWKWCDGPACDRPVAEWEGIEDVKDETCGLRRSGFVELKLPTPSRKIALLLDDADGYENLPRIDAIVPDAVWAIQQVRESVGLGVSSGYVNQRFSIGRSFDPESLELFVGGEEPGEGTLWESIEDLRDARPEDKVYQLEGDRILFGDGGYGKIPPRGEKIFASFLACEGGRGNLPAGSSWQFAKEALPFFVTNPFEAKGGVDAPQMAELFASFGERLRHVERAVTLEDYEKLALRTPGTTLARALAEADGRANRVTVTVVPESEKRLPMPTADTLEKVQAYLEERRLVTTKVAVVSPRYATLSLTLTLRIDSFDAEGVRREVTERLERFLHPLYGGLERQGWVGSKRLYISEIYLLLSRGIESLLSIDRLTATLRHPDGSRSESKREGYFELDGRSLFASGRHRVTVLVPQSGRCGGVL